MKKILLVIVSVVICISCGNGSRDKMVAKSKDNVEKQVDVLDSVYISSRKDVGRKLNEYRKRDSIIEARRQNQMELTFMGYELGKSYSNSKGEKKKLLERDYKMKVCHYDDTIYQICIEFSDYKKGLYRLGDDVINLYRYKYGRESESNEGFYTEIKEWIYSNGKIKIEIEKREFDHRGHIISKNASKPTAYIPTKNVVEVVITYLDYKADSVATQKRKREFLLEKQLEEQEKKKRYQESFKNI